MSLSDRETEEDFNGSLRSCSHFLARWHAAERLVGILHLSIQVSCIMYHTRWKKPKSTLSRELLLQNEE